LGTLPSNTIANPKSDLKAITTRNGVSYDGPQIPPKVVEDKLEILKDMSFKISFADALILMPKFASTLKALIGNKEKLSEMARTPLNEHCSAVLLKKLPENWETQAKLADHSISRSVGVAEDVYVKVGSFHISTDFVVVDFDADPRVPLILRRSFLKTGRALIDVFKVDEPPVVELKVLPPHLEYAFLEGDDKLSVIIVKDLNVEEKTALITVLKSHKRAIAWKLSDIKGINPEFCTHKILMEEDFKPTVQHREE
nr:reverse transcriptase domain-containing protein [Tanacetum cinerariifolium]